VVGAFYKKPATT